MKDWNIVATTREDAWKQARNFLSRFGKVRRSDFFNVMLLQVEDIDWFLSSFAAMVGEGGTSAKGIAHIFPARHAFSFDTREEFEAKARAGVLQLAPRLAGKTFHVRMHRRGFKGRLSSQKEEQLLDKAILDALAAAGTPAQIVFDDPDAVVDVETVGNRAGLSLWTRDEMERYAFLRFDGKVGPN